MEESTGRRLRLGTREVILGTQDLQCLQPANHLLGDPEALRHEMADKGYLFIKGLHDRQEVLDARLEVIKYVKESGEGKLDSAYPWQQGVLDSRCGRGCVPFMEGKNSVTHSDPVLKVIEGPRPHAFFKTLLGEEARTFDFKWLRAMYNEGVTGAHVDWVYMSRGTNRVYTMWTPLGDVTMEMGTLAVCEGSHKLPSFQYFQDTYGSLDIEEAKLKGTGWFSEDPLEITQRFGGQWKSSDFEAGDALIFTMRTVHMSTVNTTQLARVSCDTRWQPASLPADPRFVGDIRIEGPKFGVFGKVGDKKDVEVTIEELKEKWGFGQL